MNTGVGRARVGQWYTRWDQGEIFQVVGYDEQSRTIEIQTFDGNVDEIDRDLWSALPLAFVEPPEDWTGPVDDVEHDDLGYTETDMTEEDWAEPLRSVRPQGEEAGEEPWQDTRAEDERDAEGEGAPVEELAIDNPLAAQRLR